MGEHDGQPILTIVGELVALGPLRRDLLPTYQRWLNDFGTLRTLANAPYPMTLEAEEAWYARASIATDRAPFTVYARDDGQPIGRADLTSIDFRHRTASIGLFIGEADRRGRGYGTEIVRLLLDYAFTALGLHNVMLTAYEYNLAGLRTYSKAGFTEFGRRRQCHWMGGQWWDEVYLDCLASAFVSPVLVKILVPDAPRS